MINTVQERRAAADASASWSTAARRLTGLILLPLLMLGGRPAQAAEYCVGSPSELQAALNQAASPSQELFTTTIYLKQGTYHVGNTSLAQGTNTYALELLGGYNSDCSARTLNPDNTVFDGDGNQVRFEPLAELLIEGIRFQNAGSTLPYFGLKISAYADDVYVQVRNSALVGVHLDAYGLSSSGMKMKFVNNRVHGFVTPAGTGFSAVNMIGMTLVRVVGNTLADNAGGHGLHICTSSNVAMASNIGWNNAGDDFRVTADCSSGTNPGDAEFKNNLYQGITMNTVGGSGNNISNVDPLFVNAGAGNFRLQNTSPAINTGVVTVSTAAVDLAGNPRVVGSTVDIGAYESSFDDTIPTTLTVTTASDSGAGSLRQAILDANVNEDFNFINFNIPGACPRVIALTSADLPTIVNGVRIDGWTQPGSVSNTRTKGDNATRCIVLAGGAGRTVGLRFSGGSAEQFWVQGLAFSGFSPGGGTGEALRIVGGTGNIVRGNQFGATLSSGAGSLVLAPSDNNIVLTGFSSSTVGGESPAHRNVIADAIVNGVLVTPSGFLTSTDNDIVDNLIGSYGLEITAAGNNTGIRIQTSGNSVRGNTIINSGQDGVLMDVAAAHSNVLQANRIGRRDTICVGTFCFGGAAANGRHGLYLKLGPHDNIVYNNTIWNNTGTGIFIASGSGVTSQKNWLTANSLYDNGGAGTAFIAYNGADNDADPAQLDMANRGLNYPVIASALGSPNQGVVEGTLTTTNGSYSIDIYSSALPDSGFPRGEAQLFHRSIFGIAVTNATPGQNGSRSFSIPFSSATTNLVGRVITMTATDAAGNTSELSAPIVYTLNDTVFANGFEN